MVITYNGLEFFKVQFGNMVIALNPVSKRSKIKITEPRFKTDIAVVSFKHADFDGTGGLSSKDTKKTFVINGPGEYEVKGVFVEGFPSKTSYQEQEGINTIYKISLEGITLGFLGALGSKDLSDKVFGQLENIDVLFVPIGGNEVLKAGEAYKLAVKLSPKMIIPMHFGLVGEKDALKKFLKEEGSGNSKPLDKLTLKKSDLVGKEGEIIVLSHS
jgi:L-ascorbate metabolism protein UlaG (beta-lactamase superfamily)